MTSASANRLRILILGSIVDAFRRLGLRERWAHLAAQRSKWHGSLRTEDRAHSSPRPGSSVVPEQPVGRKRNRPKPRVRFWISLPAVISESEVVKRGPLRTQLEV